jgi:CRP/FNR family transcriptional regulator
VLGFAYPGDLLGLGAVDEHAANAVAITRTVVRCIPIQALHHGMEQNPQLGRQIYEALARELQTTRDMLFTVSQRTATERVAAFLVAIARRTRRTGGDPAEFVLPMSRSDIADFLGLTIETVSRTFTKLRTSGVIELPHSVLVTVLDEAALDDLAEGRRP